METTNKKSVQQLIDHLWQRNLTKVVISPGSRNAPLILGFTSHSKYTCYSVPDERSAGFIALGIAHASQAPVALVCSSGSALLNYYPAIAEAFYRKIPLIVLSADRPEYLIDQRDGQTIRQKNVYANHILYSSQLEEFPTDLQEQENIRIINEALRLAIPSPINGGGPAHINLPFEEPLYLKSEFNQTEIKPNSKELTIPQLNQNEKADFIDLWNDSEKIMILVGQRDPNTDLDNLLNKLSHRALILSETTSNISVKNSVECIDRLITPLSITDYSELQPDLLITFGGNVVSKRIKAFLRSNSPKHHIHVEVIPTPPDTYQCLTQHFNMSELDFFTQWTLDVDSETSIYSQKWISVDQGRKEIQKEYEPNIPFSDFQVMKHFSEMIPEESIVHLANSTSVRYAQLFNWPIKHVFHSNRGTSGIDGIVSTAIGTAIASKKPVFLIVGDISFFYDTNAWWHRHIPNNLKVIVVNNNGGGIFRFIDGPNSTGQLENHFETHQKNSVEHIALGFGVRYFCASSLTDFRLGFESICGINEAAILEVKTPQTLNAEVLKDYFKNFNNITN